MCLPETYHSAILFPAPTLPTQSNPLIWSILCPAWFNQRNRGTLKYARKRNWQCQSKAPNRLLLLLLRLPVSQSVNQPLSLGSGEGGREVCLGNGKNCLPLRLMEKLWTFPPQPNPHRALFTALFFQFFLHSLTHFPTRHKIHPTLTPTTTTNTFPGVWKIIFLEEAFPSPHLELFLRERFFCLIIFYERRKCYKFKLIRQVVLALKCDHRKIGPLFGRGKAFRYKVVVSSSVIEFLIRLIAGLRKS